MDYEFFKSAFVTMFVAIDPPGLAAIFVALTAHMTALERKSTAYRAVTIAFSILAAAAFAGKPLLSALGISIPAFRIAGGLLLFYIAFEMVFERRQERKSNSADTIAHEHPNSIAAFPLAIPLMAGPGAITATILQASNAGGDWLNLIGLVVILAVILAACLAVFLMANPIDRLMGQTGRVILNRLLGVLLAAMAIQIMGDGIFAFVEHFIHA